MAKGGGVKWFCPDASTIMAGGLAAGAQATLMDEALEDAITSQAFPEGAVVGVRAWGTIDTKAAGVYTGAHVILMVIPNGLAVPNVITHAQRRQQERYVWAQQVAKSGIENKVFHWEFELGSVRKFEMGDRLVLVCVNRDTTAYAANAATFTSLDAYIR